MWNDYAFTSQIRFFKKIQLMIWWNFQVCKCNFQK